MRRKAIKIRQFPLGGAKVNSTCIGTFLETYFVVGDSHNNVRLYTFEGEEQIAVYANHNNQSVQTEVTAIALGSTEKEIFSGTNRGIINVWDMETAKSNTPLRGHSTSVNCFGVFPEDPQKLASGSYDTTIKLWDIRQKNCTATLKGHSKQINSIAISPDGNLLLSGSEDNTARLWQMRMPQKALYISNEHNGPILKVKFNHEDCMFATCSMDKTAKYFRCEQKCYGYASSTDMIATPITAIGYSDDGKTLYTAANDVLKSWNMYKNGFLLESFEANWKGVQDLTMIKEAMMAIAFYNGSLSLWVCDVNQKMKNTSRVYEEQSSFVLPKVGAKLSKIEAQISLNELQNLVGNAVQKVNSIDDKPTRDVDNRKQQLEKKKLEMERKKEEMLKKKQQEQRRQKQLQQEREREKQRLLLEQLLREKQQREKRQQERLRKLDEERKEQDRLYNERIQREKVIQQKLKQTFEEHSNAQTTLQHDILQNSSVMNLSTFIADGAQKEKLKQIQMIGDILKDNSKYQSVLKERSNAIKPIINFWKNGKVGTALELISKSNHIIMSDCINTILSTPLFKQAITPQVGIALTSSLNELMRTNKHSTYVRLAMSNINVIVLLFKDELIKIKTFNPLTRVDLSREERLAKYDRLIDEFLNVFRQERLKKYYERKKSGDNDELCTSAFELYKNLEEVLIKIMPKQQPQLA